MSIIFLKNWRLNLLGLLMCGLFFSLSYWQYQRALEKEQLAAIFKARQKENPITNVQIEKNQALRFQFAKLSGTFLHEKTFLLDNRTFQGKIGYEIYTPFRLQNSQQIILVDRGFVAQTGNNRHSKPIISMQNPHEITGLLNLPPRLYAKGQMISDHALHPLIRIQYVDLTQLSTMLDKPIFPLILKLSPINSPNDTQNWQQNSMTKEKHLAYALQWFALSLTLLVLLVALNMRKKR